MRAIALVAALAFGLAACGGSASPARKLAPGPFVLGGVVASARDRLIENGARIDAAEVNDAGGILGQVRLRVLAGPGAGSLVRRGARALLLPCAAADQARAETAVRHSPVVLLSTCGNRPSGRAWGVGANLADRAAMLAGWLHDHGVKQVTVLPGGAAAALRRAVGAWGIRVRNGARTVLADRDWAQVKTLGRPVDGLDRLDTAAGRRTVGPAADGTVYATFGFPVPGSKLDEVYERYRLAFGRRPDGSAVQLGYDGVRVLTDAVEAARATGVQAITAALPGLQVGGAGGVLNYERTGTRQPRADAAVVEVQDGRLNLLDKGRPERP